MVDNDGRDDDSVGDADDYDVHEDQSEATEVTAHRSIADWDIRSRLSDCVVCLQCWGCHCAMGASCHGIGVAHDVEHQHNSGWWPVDLWRRLSVDASQTRLSDPLSNAYVFSSDFVA